MRVSAAARALTWLEGPHRAVERLCRRLRLHGPRRGKACARGDAMRQAGCAAMTWHYGHGATHVRARRRGAAPAARRLCAPPPRARAAPPAAPPWRAPSPRCSASRKHNAREQRANTATDRSAFLVVTLSLYSTGSCTSVMPVSQRSAPSVSAAPRPGDSWRSSAGVSYSAASAAAHPSTGAGAGSAPPAAPRRFASSASMYFSLRGEGRGREKRGTSAAAYTTTCVGLLRSKGRTFAGLLRRPGAAAQRRTSF